MNSKNHISYDGHIKDDSLRYGTWIIELSFFTTWPAEPFRQDNYTNFLDPEGFKGLSVGVLRDPFFQKITTLDRITITAFNEAIRKMSSLGATILETPLPNAPGWNYTFVGGIVTSE